MKTKCESAIILHLHEVDEVKKNWGWFLTLGVVMSLLGFWAIGSSFVATIFSMITTGIVLSAAGLVQIIHGLWAHKWKGLFLSMLLGVLYVVTGAICVTNPEASAITLTLLIGAFCLTGGIIRMGAAMILRFSYWGWTFFNGLVTFILGLMIVSQWPISGLWVIGLFIGVDILLAGLSLVALSLSARR